MSETPMICQDLKNIMLTGLALRNYHMQRKVFWGERKPKTLKEMIEITDVHLEEQSQSNMRMLPNGYCHTKEEDMEQAAPKVDTRDGRNTCKNKFKYKYKVLAQICM